MSLLSQFYPAGGGGGGSPQPAAIGYLPSTAKIVDIFMVAGGGGGGSNIGYTGAATASVPVIGPRPPQGFPGPVTVVVPIPTGSGGGGGGAGAIRIASGVVVDGGYTISIGAGGAGGGPPAGPQANLNGSNGSITSFYKDNVGDYVASGGGGGGGGGNPLSPTAEKNGLNGGHGGGAGASPDGTGTAGGLDKFTELNFIDPALNDFTISKITSTFHTGTPGSGTTAGGAGFTTSILSPATYATGGTYSLATPVVPGTGTANTGNGGGGGGASAFNPAKPGTDGYAGAAGGSGTFIIRWPSSFPDASSVTGNDPSTPSTGVFSGYYTYKWNGDGSITF